MSWGTGTKFRPGQTSQAELLRESGKLYGKGSQAQFEALDAVRVTKQSAVQEWEDFRKLPKYSHVPLAVINPSPVKRV